MAKKMNRYERKEVNRKKIEKAFQGSGRYLFRNRTSGDLNLPKINLDGKKVVSKGEQFHGDSYFMNMVPESLILVEIIEKEQKKGNNMSEEKLILDQPKTVTTEGQVEHVVDSNEKPLNEEGGSENNSEKEVLLNEEPEIDGIEIIEG